jgi:hypothetical protein
MLQALRRWSFGKVLLACLAWAFLSVVLIVGWLLLMARFLFDPSGVAAVSIGISEAMLAIPVVPPIVLVAAWLLARRVKSA